MLAREERGLGVQMTKHAREIGRVQRAVLPATLRGLSVSSVAAGDQAARRRSPVLTSLPNTRPRMASGPAPNAAPAAILVPEATVSNAGLRALAALLQTAAV